MATTIITKHGTAAPVSGDLTTGELGVDLTNKILYSSSNGTDIITVGNTYETGTFSPTVHNVTSSTIEHAVYTKIGNLVFASLFIGDLNCPNNSNQFYVSGLPFACDSYKGGGTITYGSGYVTNDIHITLGSTNITFYHGNAANSPEYLMQSDLYSKGFTGHDFDNLIITMQYFTTA